MERFLESLEQSLQNKNWYSALFFALALPDICGKMEDPSENVGPRYRSWFEKYVEPKYTRLLGPDRSQHTFLSSSDCYALRCAYLHEGAEDITEQRARETLENFNFIEPPETGTVHCNQFNSTLQLQVDLFCKDIIDGVREWLIDVNDNPEIIERLNNLITIHNIAHRDNNVRV